MCTAGKCRELNEPTAKLQNYEKTLHCTVIMRNDLPSHLPGHLFILRAMFGYQIVLRG